MPLIIRFFFTLLFKQNVDYVEGAKSGTYFILSGYSHGILVDSCGRLVPFLVDVTCLIPSRERF